ncbi:hypothetical protein AB0A69_27115 [Streptomyces sp. NPDC045431]|uniref:hypothetical protein n=1 Tax=Streptomyces sp. NPDC045431 TaxID=3155613 RepID=UPI0033DEE60A
MRDLDSVADELYGLRPDRFTAARNARAAEARKAGDQALADRIRALRKPTLAAWAGNLLVRERPEETRSLVALGEALRRAHHELDGERLRELGHRRHLVARALAREAGQLAAEAGQPVGEDVLHEVEGTLNAALVDAGAAEEWAAGRLARPLSAPVGFTAASPDAVAERPRRPPPPPPGTGDKAREGKRKHQGEERQEQRRREGLERQARLGQARRQAAAAEREAREREERHRRAREDRERAEERLHEAERRAAALAEELHEAERRAAALAEELRAAEERRRTAAAGAREARDRALEAEREARRARRRAEDAAGEAGREERSPGGPAGAG